MYNDRMGKNKQQDLQFDGQRPNEQLIFVFRRHIIAMRKGFYLLLIPFAISSLPVLIWQDKLFLLWSPVIGFGLGLVMFGYHFLMWYYSYFIVTDQRIRQITQMGLFGKDVVELNLSKIQNISYNIPGFWGEVFHFGTIVIQTYVGDLVIRNTERPENIYNKLQDAVAAVGDHEETDTPS